MNFSALWYPYTQHKHMDFPLQVASASGVELVLHDGRVLVDAISSWWCVIHGYAHPRLVAAMQDQVSKLSHVMLGGLTHSPALMLAEKLVDLSPEPLTKVFFSDSGSVGVEVAIKMAIQYHKNKGVDGKHKLIALNGAYHGDTTGCMSVCDPVEGMHHIFRGAILDQYFVEPPKEGVLSEEDALLYLEALLKEKGHECAAFIYEPLVQCVGNFNMYSPSYLNRARVLCDTYNVLMIADEVATGFGRTGTLFATNQTDMCPDIMVVGKGLTGGMIGLAATLATDKVFDSFIGDTYESAFMHGPTFMGNPLACRTALESIAVFEEEHCLEKVSHIESLLDAYLPTIHSEKIVSWRVKGAIGVIEVRHPHDYKRLAEMAIDYGVWLRPFGCVVYLMPSYCITDQQLHTILNLLTTYFERGDHHD